MTETWKDLRELLAEILALQEEKGGESGEGPRVLGGLSLDLGAGARG